MLPREFRLRTAAEFAAVIKAGRRAGTQRLVVHALLTEQTAAPRAGFVVSGKIGNSVVRHRITRRLRPLVRRQLGALAPGTAIVVRALPAAATATSAELGSDLHSGVVSAIRKARSSGGERGSPWLTGSDLRPTASSVEIGPAAASDAVARARATKGGAT